MKKRGKRALLFLSTIMLVCGLILLLMPSFLIADSSVVTVTVNGGNDYPNHTSMEL